MSEAASILPQAFAPMAAAMVTAGYGILVEKHFVGKASIALNAMSFVLLIFFVDLFTVQFLIASVFFAIGMWAMLTDVRKSWQSGEVAWMLGSKTLGAVGLYLAFASLGWLQFAEPIARQFIEEGYPVTETDLHVFGFITIFAIVQTLGAAAWAYSKMQEKGIIAR